MGPERGEEGADGSEGREAMGPTEDMCVGEIFPAVIHLQWAKRTVGFISLHALLDTGQLLATTWVPLLCYIEWALTTGEAAWLTDSFQNQNS